LKITSRIKKIIQSNILFVKTKIDSSDYKEKLTSFAANAKQGFFFKQKTYKDTQKSNNVDNGENNKYRTARVIFKERMNRRVFIRDLFLMPLSFLKSRRNHLKAIYATRNGYKTCDYSQNKGFYNF